MRSWVVWVSLLAIGCGGDAFSLSDSGSPLVGASTPNEADGPVDRSADMDVTSIVTPPDSGSLDGDPDAGIDATDVAVDASVASADSGVATDAPIDSDANACVWNLATGTLCAGELQPCRTEQDCDAVCGAIPACKGWRWYCDPAGTPTGASCTVRVADAGLWDAATD